MAVSTHASEPSQNGRRGKSSAAESGSGDAVGASTSPADTASTDTGTTESAPAISDSSAPPAGFEQSSGDLAGYWETASPESMWKGKHREASHGSKPVLFTPLFVTLSDSDLDKRKTSTLLHARLLAPCTLRSAVKEEGYKEFPAGTLFGIWTKPGMKPLQVFGGAQVWMSNGQEIGGERVFFKDIGKPSPMVLFDIRHKGSGQKLKIREDRRDQSLPENLREKRAIIAEDLGDIPF